MVAKTKAKYRVSGEITISVSTDVVAESPEKAIERAQQRAVMSLCHQCATGEPGAEWVTSGEMDGEPENLTVESL